MQLAKTQQHLLNDSRLKTLQNAVNNVLGRSVKISVDLCEHTTQTPAALQQQRSAERQQHAEQEIYNDNGIKSIIDTFDAEINPQSIAPID